MDFALGADLRKAVALSPRRASLRPRAILGELDGESDMDRIIRVCHGPVHYEDQVPVIPKTVSDFASLHALRGIFTKSTAYARSGEYRFAVYTVGSFTIKKLLVPISDELKALTMKLDYQNL